MDKLAIVVPCYNEEEVLKIASRALREVLDDLIAKEKIAKESFILFVNDGSRDRTWELIEEEHRIYPSQVCGVNLAGNVGHQFALTAGLITAKDMSDVTISIDAEIAEDQMTIPFVKELNLLEPYGMGNPQPTFIIKNAKIAKIAALKDGKHLKLIVCKKKKSVDCIGFSMGHYVESLRVGDTVSLACNLYINDYRGECYFGVRIRDIRLS